MTPDEGGLTTLKQNKKSFAMKPPSMIDIFKQWNLLRNLIVAGGIYFIV